ATPLFSNRTYRCAKALVKGINRTGVIQMMVGDQNQFNLALTNHFCHLCCVVSSALAKTGINNHHGIGPRCSQDVGVSTLQGHPGRIILGHSCRKPATSQGGGRTHILSLWNLHAILDTSHPAKHLPEIPTTSMIGSLPIHKPIPQPSPTP